LNLFLGDLQDVVSQALGNGHATAAYADQGNISQAAIMFENFVGNAGERARDALGIHDYWHIHLFANSQVRV
jgi:hypothetical protein